MLFISKAINKQLLFSFKCHKLIKIFVHMKWTYLMYYLDSFLTREYTNRNEWVIGMDGKFTHLFNPSLKCKLFPRIYDKITKFDFVIV